MQIRLDWSNQKRGYNFLPPFIALYFNLYFSFWNRLTILRLLGAFTLSAGLLGFAYLTDPVSAQDREGVLLALLCLPLTLTLFNGLKRLLSARTQTHQDD